MSAGGFIVSKYELTAGEEIRVPIRVQPETLTLTINTIANAAPAGAYTAHMPSARVTGGRRGLGIFARLVRFEFTATPPTGYKEGETLSLPALSPEFYDECTYGATGTYTVAGSTVAVRVIGTTAEKIR